MKSEGKKIHYIAILFTVIVALTPGCEREKPNSKKSKVEGTTQKKETPKMASAIASAELFRILASEDFPAAKTKYFDNPSVGSETTLDMYDSSWEAILQFSHVIPGNLDARHPIITYVNPFYDLVVLSKWNASGKIIKILMLRGDSFMKRKDSEVVLPRYMTLKGPYGFVLVKTFNELIKELLSRFPIDSSEDVDFGQYIEDPGKEFGVSLGNVVVSGQDYAAVITDKNSNEFLSVIHAYESEDWGKLTELVGDEWGQLLIKPANLMEKKLRDNLKMVHVIVERNGTETFWVDPDFSLYFYTLRITKKKSGKFRRQFIPWLLVNKD